MLEGIDGSGTTTQARLLVDRLRARGRRAHLTREPSDGPIGVLIRQILTGRVVSRSGEGRCDPVDGATVALLFAADRLDHLRAEVEPALEAGVDVVSDRYVISSLAYQALDNDVDWVRSINSRARVADLTLFLDVPAAVALERRRATRNLEERFESLSAQERVEQSYRALISEEAGLGCLVRLDGTTSSSDVADSIWREVSELLPETE